MGGKSKNKPRTTDTSIVKGSETESSIGPSKVIGAGGSIREAATTTATVTDVINDATEKLMADVANLRIHDQTSEWSSCSQCRTGKGRPQPAKQRDDGQENRPRDEVVAERKAKAEEAKARKAAAAEAKKALKQSGANVNAGKAVDRKGGQNDDDAQPVGIDEKQQKRQRMPAAFKCMKDPGIPSGFRASQPFRAVHFDLTRRDDDVEEGPSRKISFSEIATSNIHPSFLEFASRCEAKNVVGIDAICVVFVQSFKQFLLSYTISPNQVMSRDLEQAVRQQLSYLTENGKHSFPLALGNLIRQLKKEISQLPDSVSEDEGKEHLQQWLDDFVQQNFELALQAISSFCLKKMKNTPFVLTYSWCPVVERIILDAHEEKLLFHVHVLDSPIDQRGRQLVKTLCERKIHCSYGMLSSVGYLMKDCHMVLLGCSAILSNGCAVAVRGSGQVALVASASNIPVLVAAQTCKFVDRVQSFSRGVHEISALAGERQEAVPADLITAVVTELRILPPSSAPAVLKAKQLAVDS